MNLCILNAQGLLRTARRLHKVRAYSHSAVLTIIAIEEASKTPFLVISAHPDSESLNDKALGKVWKIFRSHDAKLHFMEDHDFSRWRGLLYVRRRQKNARHSKHLERQIRSYRKAEAYLAKYLSDGELTSLAQLKLRCMYVDNLNARSPNFVPPLRIPPGVSRSLLAIAEWYIRDARKLRDTFRRADIGKLAEDLADIILKDQYLYDVAHQLGVFDDP